MFSRTQKAFTMIEMIFVIVVIGILSAIAVPKFATTADTAYITKGKTTLASVRNAIAAERQRRVLMGDFNDITDLCAGDAGYIFTKFNADTQGEKREVIGYPPKSGTSDGQWQKSGTDYTFYFHDGSTAKSCTFVLSSNKLTLKSGTTCPELDN